MIPVISSGDQFTQVIFHRDIKPDEDIDDLITFIQDIHERYYARYTTQSPLSRSVRIVYPEKLAEMLLYQIDSRNDFKGQARIYITIMSESIKSQQYFIKEYVQYSIHWHTDEKDELTTIWPIGFQVFQNHKFDEKAMISNVVFDLRVLHKEIEDSEKFYIDKAIPNLKQYFEHLTLVFEAITNQKLKADFSSVQAKLDDIITDFYEHRIENPDDNERQIVFLDACYTGTEQNNVALGIHIRVDRELTSTPYLHVTHPEYKATEVKRNDILHSYKFLTEQPVFEENGN